MRFFLRIVADVSESDELLSIVAAHGRSLGTAIAPVFGRSPDDPDILAFVDLMRGRAMRHLLHPEQPVPDRSEMIADAARLSLKRAQSDGQNDNATTLPGGLQMNEPNTNQTGRTSGRDRVCKYGEN